VAIENLAVIVRQTLVWIERQFGDVAADNADRLIHRGDRQRFYVIHLHACR
jgi:hypothetical protein